MKSTSSRMERARQAQISASAEGLCNTGKEHVFFKALAIGEARPTLAMHRSRKGAALGSSKIREQWWAPADLVRLNTYLLKRGVSSKMRAKALRYLSEGKDLPDRLNDELAGYTESLLRRG